MTTDRTQSVVAEADEVTAPIVFLYLGGVLTWLAAVLSWVYFFRGYA
ncbi:hypothetical protein VT84_10425 [Gemmata sp. SH-PL17]|uniref:Uncharacterized protein n=1 Tax=Gemmata massiliana TaxID=1210884 RepID=A0A6P2D449_9BACT|nr:MULTISPECIES: hypothetical protein [Gemmata]AMV24802.1 hypothetical protein VT84_10425 [Gemmata sp. SH-PL17]VTR95919.1 unnamed protein product [Gemmata massiliana]